MNCHQPASPRTWFASTIAVRNENDSRQDRHQEDADGDAGRLELVGVADLLDALEDGEGAAEAEQHHRRRRRPRSSARGRSRRGGSCRPPVAARRPPSSSSPWLPESATEWIASASIEAEPVMRKPTSFATAMPEVGEQRGDDRLGAMSTASHRRSVERRVPARIPTHDAARPGGGGSARAGGRRPHPDPVARRARRAGPAHRRTGCSTRPASTSAATSPCSWATAWSWSTCCSAPQLGGIWLTAVNWHLTAAEVAYIVEDSGSTVLFTDPEHEAHRPRGRGAGAGRGRASSWPVPSSRRSAPPAATTTRSRSTGPAAARCSTRRAPPAGPRA